METIRVPHDNPKNGHMLFSNLVTTSFMDNQDKKRKRMQSLQHSIAKLD